MRLAQPLLLLMLTGCGISQEKFIEKYAVERCDRLEECAKLSVEHGTYDECIQYYEIVADEQMIPEGCAIISDKARTCLKELRKTKDDCKATESDWPACAEVGDCPGGGGGSDTGL